MPNARESTDEETAPLLDEDRRDDSFFSALLHPARPLTNLEKILAGGAVLLLLLTATFVGLFAGAESALKKRPAGDTVTVTTTAHATATTTVGSTPTGAPSAPNVCLSSDCVLLSSTILQALNTSVDPCENFYEFAVGGWKATHSIPDDKPMIGTFNEVDDNNKKLLMEIISSIPDKSESQAGIHEENLHKLKTTFNSCMDIEKLNEIGVEPLIELTDHVIELFGPYDLIPAPDASGDVSWRGLWHNYPRLPDYLIESAIRKVAALEGKFTGRESLDPNVKGQEIEESNTVVEKERRDKITKTMAWLESRGASSFVNFQIEGDSGGDDPQMQSLFLYQAEGGLPTKEYYEEKPILDLYHSIVKGILVDVASHSHESVKRGLTEDVIEELALKGEAWPWPWPGKGDDPDGDDKSPGQGGNHKTDEPLEDRMEKLAGKVVAFERELMRAGADPEYLGNPKYAYNPYSTDKVGEALPFLDIPQYLAVFGVRTFPENITVTHPPYLKSVTHLVDTTPDYILSAYFTLRLAFAHGSALGYDTGVWQELRRLKETLSGLKPGTKEVRQDVCLRWVDGIVGYIAGAEFIDRAFSQDARKDAEDIINSIIKTFHDHIPDVPWMDKESAEAAQIKANSIRPRIGYATTPNVVDPQSLSRWYQAVDVKAGDFFGTVLSSTLAEENRAWQTLGKRRDNGTWEMTPQTVNAYYNPPDSEITFPAGILQPPFYSKSFPAHLNYGAFGAVAAHELGHAFDNNGAQVDEKGRLRDWWTNKTVEAFNERAQCLARQYNKYYILDPNGKKVYVNGNLTNGENIGDAGLSQAYNAWKSSLSSSSAPKAELRLPGLDYTDEQLFFMAFARVWADLIRPASAVSRVRSDPHSPNIWRAMGTLRNSAEFHKSFGCKVGSGMNPPKEEQCQLWA